jgi:Kef-type K+ transport system membrane component KefB
LDSEQPSLVGCTTECVRASALSARNLLLEQYIDADAVSFAHFLLFVAVAFSITAFPVLARILVSMQLLKTDVGVTVVSLGAAPSLYSRRMCSSLRA